MPEPGTFSEDVDDLFGAPVGFEFVQSFRGAVTEVKPLIAKGAVEVKFLIFGTNIAPLAPLIDAAGRMLEVSVAKKVWAGDYDTEDLPA